MAADVERIRMRQMLDDFGGINKQFTSLQNSLQNKFTNLQDLVGSLGGASASGLMPNNLPTDPFNQGIYGLSQGNMYDFMPNSINPYMAQFAPPHWGPMMTQNIMPQGMADPMAGAQNAIGGVQRGLLDFLA